MIGALIGDLWPYIGGAVALIGAVFGTYMKGRKDANAKHQLENANDYQETSERIDGVDLSGDDADWLRDRNKR